MIPIPPRLINTVNRAPGIPIPTKNINTLGTPRIRKLIINKNKFNISGVKRSSGIPVMKKKLIPGEILY